MSAQPSCSRSVASDGNFGRRGWRPPRARRMLAEGVATRVAHTDTQATEIAAGAVEEADRETDGHARRLDPFGLPPRPDYLGKWPYVYIGGQKAHSLHARGFDVIQSLTPWAEESLLLLLKDPKANWQPQDLLPDAAGPDFEDQVRELRARARELPDAYLVALVGDMVTEEALPSYMNMLNLLDGTKDETGAQSHAWARWTRAWTAEENRHGDALHKWLYLSGRVDMRAVESTIQRLIGAGLDPKLENIPYLCFVYTSFQERATRVSHGNTARLAKEHGDGALARLCGLVASDEARHEEAYKRIVGQVMQRDPEGAVLAFGDMMRKGILMPAHLMDDGVHSEANRGRSLFDDYATVAEAAGVYTARDYASIVEHLVARWGVADVQGLRGDAAREQEFLMQHASRIHRLADLAEERRERARKRGAVPRAQFAWLHGREVPLS